MAGGAVRPGRASSSARRPAPAGHFRTSVHASPAVRRARCCGWSRRVDDGARPPGRPGPGRRRAPAAASCCGALRRAAHRPRSAAPAAPAGGGDGAPPGRTCRRRSAGGRPSRPAVTGRAAGHRVAGQRAARRGRAGRRTACRATCSSTRRPARRRSAGRWTRPTRRWLAAVVAAGADARRARAEIGRPRDAAWAAACRAVAPRAARWPSTTGTCGTDAPGGRHADRLPGRAGRSPPVPDGTCDVTAHVAIDAVAAAGGRPYTLITPAGGAASARGRRRPAAAGAGLDRPGGLPAGAGRRVGRGRADRPGRAGRALVAAAPARHRPSTRVRPCPTGAAWHDA